MTELISISDAKGPDGIRIYAIGDIHGYADLLADLLKQIESDIASNKVEDWRIIFLGDYVDRGPASKEVLDILIELSADVRYIFLAGNHDTGFLEFLPRPDIGGLFSRFGGIETALSYGIEMPFSKYASFAELLEDHDKLLEAVPNSHVEFLRNLKFKAEFGDFFFCHAGIRPGIALDEQTDEDLHWIRSPFLESEELYSKVIVHGHTVTAAPDIKENRINIDTHAYRSGVLTALVIDGANYRFLQTK